jgi:hypothetical protein
MWCFNKHQWASEDPPTPADQGQVRALFEQARTAFRRAVPGSATFGPAPRGRAS